MKTLKAICAAAVLALTLTISAHADGGDGHGTGRSVSEPIVSGTPDGSTDSAATADLGSGFATYVDIIWALASIY